MNTGGIDYTLNAGDTMRILFGQMAARGTNNVNSVTKLKDLCRAAKLIYETNFPVSVFNISNEVPATFALMQNYPNPFNPVTRIRFGVAQPSPRLKPFSSPQRLTDLQRGTLVVLKVYDMLGREVRTLVNEMLEPGTYEVRFDGSGLNSSVYFYRLTAGDFTETRKMVMLK